MKTLPTYETVVDTVRTWPTKSRIALIQEVLATLTPDETPTKKQATLPQALGLARGAGPVPTDADVDALLEEHRREKFGR